MLPNLPGSLQLCACLRNSPGLCDGVPPIVHFFQATLSASMAALLWSNGGHGMAPFPCSKPNYRQLQVHERHFVYPIRAMMTLN